MFRSLFFVIFLLGCTPETEFSGNSEHAIVNGIFSYTQQFAFSPEHDIIELFSDGEIKLISMEFHELVRTW